MSDNKPLPKIQSVLVGFSIIDLVAKSPHPIKFNDIHHSTKITKSNLYKYLNTLTSLGVLHRDKETGLYSGGPALIEYGMATANRENVIEKVTPYLEDVNLLTKETTLLAIWTVDGPMIIKMIYSQAGLNLGGQVGTILPIESAGGKLFASFMSGPIIDKWISDQTAHLSEVEQTRMKKEFADIRKSKIAFASEALAPSVISTAIPILNYERKILGAVIVVGFKETVPSSPEDELSIQLLEHGKEISKIFGYKEEN